MVLRHLRYIDDERRLWIDAICVNQFDDDVKAIQAGFMAEIYKLASRVIVWLGRERKDGSPEILALKYLGGQFKVTINGFYLLLPDTEQTDWHRSEVAQPYDE